MTTLYSIINSKLVLIVETKQLHIQ